MNTYEEGDLVRISATFTTDGVPIDPSAVIFKYKTPAGEITTKIYGTDPEVIKDGTGQYHIDVSVEEDGLWSYRVYSTGTGQAAAESEFSVRKSVIV